MKHSLFNNKLKSSILALGLLFGSQQSYSQNCAALATVNHSNGTWTKTDASDVSVLINNSMCVLNQATAGNTANRIYRALPAGTIPASGWKANVDFTFSGVGAGGSCFSIIALTAGNLDPMFSAALSSNPTNQDGIVLSINSATANNSFLQLCVKDGSGAVTTNTSIFLGSPSSPATTYFITMERLTLGDARLSVFSNAARTVHVSGSPFCFNIDGDVSGLNTIQHGGVLIGSTSRNVSGTIANMALSCITPTIPASPTVSPASVCSSGSATLTATAPGPVYSWFSTATGGTALTTGASYTTPVISSNTTYYTETRVGCVRSPRTATIVTVNTPPVVNAITSTETNVCPGKIISLQNTTPNGVWSSSNTSLATVSNGYVTASATATGNVTISYTVTSGACTTAATKAITVGGGVGAFIISGPSTVCPNTSGAANTYTVTPAVAGADYTWNIQNAPNVGVYFPVAGSTSCNLAIPGSVTNNPFTLRCYGSNACGTSAIVTKAVALSSDVPNVPDIQCSTGDNCATLSVTSANYGSSTIQWIVGGVVQSTAASYTRPLSTPVLCTFTSPFGCKTSRWYSPAVVCTYAARLAEEIELPADKPFLIYPNPTKGVFKIDTKGQSGTASIYDVTGRLVRDIDLTENLNSYTVEIGTPGVYTIVVKTANDNKGYKIVVE